MDLTFHIHSWHLPLAVTIAWVVITALIGRAESREGGDFAIPLFTMICLFGGGVATLVAWGMWVAMHFIH